MPRPVHQYVKSQGRKLLAEFEELRGKHKDPDVKGGGNEGIVKEFMQRHLPFKVVVQNTSIIDTNDQQSDELDLVLQVKANLTTTEIRRTVRNCRSVKRLQRVTSDNDYILVDAPADIPFFVDRIPYICFAFESRLRLSTVANRLRDECQNTPIEEQPDAVFVLGKGMVVNARNGEGTLAHGQVGFQTASLVDELGDWTLLGLMRSIYLMMPRVRRWQYPVVHYLSTGIYTGGKLLMR